MNKKLSEFTQKLNESAKKYGAKSSYSIAIASDEVAIEVRNKKPENIESSNFVNIGLRVFLGNQSAIVSGSLTHDFDSDEFASRAISMAKVSPIDDIEIINTELILADLNSVEKIYEKAIKSTKSGQKEGLELRELLEKILPVLERGHSVRTLDFNEEELKLLKGFQLLTFKPVLYVANVSEDGFQDNPNLDLILDFANEEKAQAIAICASIESEISELEDKEKSEFLHEMGQSESGLDRLTKTGYTLLGLQTYFTAGPQEVRAWTINVGDTAPKAAGKIHGDFEKGFIRAETISFADFIENDGEKGAKESGKLKTEGKDYIVQDGDVLHFLFNS